MLYCLRRTHVLKAVGSVKIFLLKYINTKLSLKVYKIKVDCSLKNL